MLIRPLRVSQREHEIKNFIDGLLNLIASEIPSNLTIRTYFIFFFKKERNNLPLVFPLEKKKKKTVKITSNLSRIKKTLKTGDGFMTCFVDCHFDETIFSSLGERKVSSKE